MSQHTINCPVCKTQHTIEAFRSGGMPTLIISLTGCGFREDNPATMNKLLGLEEVHRQRVQNMEMPAYDE